MTEEKLDFSGSTYTLKITSGHVLGAEKYSETHISSSGGSNYVGPGGGAVSAPRISSYTTTNQDFWLAVPVNIVDA